MTALRAAAVAPGTYRVEHAGRYEIVYVAGRPGDLWAFWRGRVFRVQAVAGREEPSRRPPSAATPKAAATTRGPSPPQVLTAPMPATVIGVEVAPGDSVREGVTLVLLEAMKMELPIRAPSDGIVRAVHCRPGSLVTPDAPLVEIE